MVWYPSALSAQEQVAFDRAEEVYVIDRSLRDQLGLFQEYEGFIEATLFRVDEDTYELNIFTRTDNTRQRRQVLYGSRELARLRNEVSQQLAGLPPVADQEGRTRFLIGTTVLSAGFYGWAAPLALDVTDGTAAGAAYLIISSAGYFVPALITSNITLKSGDASASLYGGYRGMLHGFAISGLLEPSDDLFDNARRTLLLGTAGSVGGLIYGYRHSRKHDYNEGQSHFFRASGDYGILMGIGVAAILGENTNSLRASSAGYLIAAGAGHWASHHWTRNSYATVGNARFMRASYFLGAVLPSGFLNLAGAEEPTVVAASIMAGASAGMLFSNRLNRKKAFTDRQGLSVGLGTLGSYLLGSGAGLLIMGPGAGQQISAAVGGLAGYAISLRRALRNPSRPDQAFNLDFDLAFEPVLNTFRNAAAIDSFVPVLRLHGTL
ncbi:MAG: hypothetical protein WDZ53_05715 [Balneolales bacterium]